MLVDDLSFVKPLGKGSFAEVILALKKDTKKKFAIKQVDKEFVAHPIVETLGFRRLIHPLYNPQPSNQHRGRI